MDVMLGFLLFAGAMHTNFDQLRIQRWPVMVFATVGVISSTFLVGVISYYVLGYLGLPMKFIHCMLFGALISPTDPIAVLGILKLAGVPKRLETKIVGESLFNDGVGVVVFLTIFSIATGGAQPDHGDAHTADSHAAIEQAVDSSLVPVSFQPKADVDEAAEKIVAAIDGAEEQYAESHGGTDILSVAKLFFVEVGGGILMGLALGYGTFVLLRSIDDYEIEVMITLACVMGGCSLAQYLHISGPLAMVVAGLIVGNDTVRGTSMSKQTEIYVDKFWELIDNLLNAILFVLIGLEILILQVEPLYVIAGLVSIVVVLVSRYLSLIVPVTCFAKRLQFAPHTTTIMTWGGLRGGISIALALVLPEECRAVFLMITYIVVIFSIIVQGLTVGSLAKRLIGAENME